MRKYFLDWLRVAAFGVLILAIRRRDQLVTQPPADAAVGVGDELVAFGTSAQLRALESAS